MEWMILPLKRYADFSGRSRRKEYWMFTLLLILLIVPFVAIMLASADPAGDGEISTLGTVALLIFGLFYLAIIIPSIAVQVRRFHDQDKSGWFVLMNFIPYVGGLIVLVFMCLEGTKGENRFGPDPKMNDNVGDVFS
ncbi:MAG: DUF805 domain-containing protein [Pseudomonadota bacterium]